MKRLLYILLLLPMTVGVSAAALSRDSLPMQPSTTQILQLKIQSKTGYNGYEVLKEAGLYTENLLLFDSLRNDNQKICIKKYRINEKRVEYEFVNEKIRLDSKLPSPIVVQSFFDGRTKRYKKEKCYRRGFWAHDLHIELTCINMCHQEHYVFSIMEAPPGLPVEICNYLWQCLLSASISD